MRFTKYRRKKNEIIYTRDVERAIPFKPIKWINKILNPTFAVIFIDAAHMRI